MLRTPNQNRYIKLMKWYVWGVTVSCNKFHWESAEKHILKDPKFMILLYLRSNQWWRQHLRCCCSPRINPWWVLSMLIMCLEKTMIKREVSLLPIIPATQHGATTLHYNYIEHPYPVSSALFLHRFSLFSCDATIFNPWKNHLDTLRETNLLAHSLKLLSWTTQLPPFHGNGPAIMHKYASKEPKVIMGILWHAEKAPKTKPCTF